MMYLREQIHEKLPWISLRFPMRGLCTNWWLVYKSGKIKINLVRHLKNDYFQNSVSSSGKIGSANQHFCWELRKPDKNKAKNNHRAKDQNEDTWRTRCSLCNKSSPEARANSKRNRCDTEKWSRASQSLRKRDKS